MSPCGVLLHILKRFKKSCEWPEGWSVLSQAWCPVPARTWGGVAPALGLLPGSRPPLPVVPQTPMQSGATSGRQGYVAGGARGGLGDSSSSLHRTSATRGACCLQSVRVCVCVCVRKCVYLPSDLSVHIHVCGNVGAEEAGRGTRSGPPFSAPVLVTSAGRGVMPQSRHSRRWLLSRGRCT